MNDYEKLKQAIQQANPEKFIFEFDWIDSIPEDIYPKVAGELYKITLADVLLAMPIEMQLHHEPTRLMFKQGFGLEKRPTDWVSWNLKDDNLDHQSAETKQFLINLFTNG